MYADHGQYFKDDGQGKYNSRCLKDEGGGRPRGFLGVDTELRHKRVIARTRGRTEGYDGVWMSCVPAIGCDSDGGE